MVGITRMEVEGPLPPCINGGMVGTTVARVGPPLVGGGPTTVCAVARIPLGPGPVGPVEAIPGMMGGMEQAHYQSSPLKGVRRCTNHGARWGGEQSRFGLIRIKIRGSIWL